MNKNKQIQPLIFVDAVWTGNTKLGIVAKNVKTTNPFTWKKVTVWVWGIVGEYINFTVSAGDDSEYSYTGLCKDCYDLDAGCIYVNILHTNRKLIK